MEKITLSIPLEDRRLLETLHNHHGEEVCATRKYIREGLKKKIGESKCAQRDMEEMIRKWED